jgi:hypothetical protein
MRRTGIRNCNTLVAAMLIMAPLGFAQESPSQAVLRTDVVGPQLIAWSQLQEPKPVAQPLPSDREEQPQQPQRHPAPQSQQLSPQILSGTIARDGDRYLLVVSQSSGYAIQDIESVSPYEGKRVKMAADLDSKTQVLHVTRIEFLDQ